MERIKEFGNRTVVEYCDWLIREQHMPIMRIRPEEVLLAQHYLALYAEVNVLKPITDGALACTRCGGRGERLWSDGLMHECSGCDGTGTR